MTFYIISILMFVLFFSGFMFGYYVSLKETEKLYKKIIPNKNLGRRKEDKKGI